MSESPAGVTPNEEIETILTARRTYERLRQPAPEKFTLETLRQTHQHIFQDFPAYGLEHPRPGKFRDSMNDNKGDWAKARRLLSGPDNISFVCYSPMSETALAEAGKALEKAQPERLRTLPPAEFAKEMSALYAQLDYLHPFEEGNSRALRTFTRQLARESGYDLDWERLNRTDKSRDRLFLARDRAVGEIAVGRIQSEGNEIRAVHSMIQFEGNPGLTELMTAITRPSRAVAFAHVPGQEAVKTYPELAPAYAALRAVEAKAEIDGLTKPQRNEVVGKARANIVAQIAQGNIPGVERQETISRQSSPQSDLDLSR